jgi:hypothetical protein
VNLPAVSCLVKTACQLWRPGHCLTRSFNANTRNDFGRDSERWSVPLPPGKPRDGDTLGTSARAAAVPVCSGDPDAHLYAAPAPTVRSRSRRALNGLPLLTVSSYPLTSPSPLGRIPRSSMGARSSPLSMAWHQLCSVAACHPLRQRGVREIALHIGMRQTCLSIVPPSRDQGTKAGESMARQPELSWTTVVWDLHHLLRLFA